MDKIDEVLTRGVDEIIVKDSLKEKLKSGKKLIVKLGIDPTGPRLHLGHAVVLRKLKEFQELGHQIVLVIGDFTAKIGDPSGRTQERKALDDKQISNNMESYKEQAGKILDIAKTKFEYNSSWLGKLGMGGLFELASKATIAQIMERKEFRERLKEDNDIPYLEMLYPLMQGYDSVYLKADVELGGTDQKFNLLMGRQIQKRYGQQEQDVVTMKLLSGTDGAKMSKSAGNFISLDTEPADMYGKIMSISDELIPEYFELCTDIPIEKLENIKKTVEGKGPAVLELKKELAENIVGYYFGTEPSKAAEKDFETVFQKGEYEGSLLIQQTLPSGLYKPADIPIASGVTTSMVQSKELFRQGAVDINGTPVIIEDWSKPINLAPGEIVKIGKRRIIKIEK